MIFLNIMLAILLVLLVAVLTCLTIAMFKSIKKL